MQQAAARRLIPFFGQSRKFARSDFDEFDLIQAMDRQNLEDLKSAKPHEDCRAEIKLFGDFVDVSEQPDVPDPYYGGPEGFDDVFVLVQDAARGLLRHIQQNDI